uniref:Peroxidase-like n=1 Tax=Hirondellea gigas TaxID=1518452 RepID=A0A2P2HX17_9CRUS
MEQIEQRNVFERELVFNNIVAEVGSPVFLHARLFEPNDEVKAQAKNAALTLGATLNLVKKFNLSKEEAEFGLSKVSVANTIIADTCPVEPVCTETKYRSRDGSCNNLKNKKWGQAATSYQRILPPDYSDGANAPRRSVTGAPLPSARTLSRNMLVANEEVYKEFTLLIMQWGQFVTHDITHTPIGQVTINGQDVSCCERNGKRHAPENLHPECLPINILPDDPFLAQFGRECMGFVRSMPAIRRECKFGPREQINQITSYIDASNVYGSTKSVADSLREAEGGRLKVNRHEGRDLLPSSRTALGCGPRQRPPLCFLAGDVRVNEQPDLVVIHTIWMRQHNNVAGELARLNPGWNNEVLYQEARRIVIAQMQHITYNEYLPIVLGQQFMVSFGLVPLSEGHANTYLTQVDASVNNAFAAAAFRYGHTLVTTHVQGFSKFGTLERNLKLSQTQFAPFFLYEKNSLDSLIRGLTIQPSQKFDSKFSDEVINRLFAGNGSFGLDLVALNIQRGRDHGLPSYNQWRKICHLPLAKSFNDLTDVMNLEDAQHLSTMYQHVDDIDLFVGGLLEHPKVGSLVGHTFLCIVGDQFARLKLGDRFYYENGGLRSSFSEAQLEQIRKTSLSRILCDNSDNVENMQPLAFVQGHLANRRVSCNDVSVIPKISLDPWRNEPVWV